MHLSVGDVMSVPLATRSLTSKVPLGIHAVRPWHLCAPMGLMPATVEERYQRLLTELGVRKRWYQTNTDLFYAAAVAAVADVDSETVAAGAAQLGDELPASHDLHLIRDTVAAIAAARRLDIGSFIAATDEATELLREATRSKRFRRIAGSVLAADGGQGLQLRTTQVTILYRLWKERHLTNASDLVLAATTETVGIDPAIATRHADIAASQLKKSDYERQWDLARVLALHHRPDYAADQFVALGERLRGWRRKPITDNRQLIAIAALSEGANPDLPKLVADRVKSVRTGRWRPGHRTALTLAALLTFGESLPPDDRLVAAFHGLAIREHYAMSYSEAMSG